MKNLFNSSYEDPYVNPDYRGNDDIDPANLTVGVEYIIQSTGNTVWTDLGATYGTRNERFTATAQAPAGTTGLAIQAHGLYERLVEVINTDSNHALDSAAFPQYRTHLNPADPTQNLKNITRNIAEFNNYYQLDAATGDMSREDIWYKPLVIGNVTDTSTSVLWASVTDSAESTIQLGLVQPMQFTSVGHSIPGNAGDWSLATIENFNGLAAELNGTTMYVSRSTNDKFNLAYDSNGNNPYILRDHYTSTLSSSNLGDPLNITLTAAHDFYYGERVLATGFNNSLSFLNGNHYYVDPTQDGSILQLYEDPNSPINSKISLAQPTVTSAIFKTFETNNPSTERLVVSISVPDNYGFQPQIQFPTEWQGFLGYRFNQAYDIDLVATGNTSEYWLRNSVGTFYTMDQAMVGFGYDDPGHFQARSTPDVYVETLNQDLTQQFAAFSFDSALIKDVATGTSPYPDRSYVTITRIENNARTGSYSDQIDLDQVYFLKNNATTGGIEFYKDYDLTEPLFDYTIRSNWKTESDVAIDMYRQASYIDDGGTIKPLFQGQLFSDQGTDLMHPDCLGWFTLSDSDFTGTPNQIGPGPYYGPAKYVKSYISPLESQGNDLPNSPFRTINPDNDPDVTNDLNPPYVFQGWSVVDDQECHPYQDLQTLINKNYNNIKLIDTGETLRGQPLVYWQLLGNPLADSLTLPTLTDTISSNDLTWNSGNSTVTISGTTYADGYYAIRSYTDQLLEYKYCRIINNVIDRLYYAQDGLRTGIADASPNIGIANNNLLISKKRYHYVAEVSDAPTAISLYCWPKMPTLPAGVLDVSQNEMFVPKYLRDTPLGSGLVVNDTAIYIYSFVNDGYYPRSLSPSFVWPTSSTSEFGNQINPLWAALSKGTRITAGSTETFIDSVVDYSFDNYTFKFAKGVTLDTVDISGTKILLDSDYDWSTDFNPVSQGVYYITPNKIETDYTNNFGESDALSYTMNPMLDNIADRDIVRTFAEGPVYDGIRTNPADQYDSEHGHITYRVWDPVNFSFGPTVYYDYTDATTGTLDNEKPTFVKSTTGDVLSATPNYELTSVELLHGGNQQFSFIDSNGNPAYGSPAVEIQNVVWKPWETSPTTLSGTPDVTIFASAGLIQSVTLNSNLDVPEFTEPGKILLTFDNAPDQYVPPAADLIEAQETFDTASDWGDAGEGQKYWPTTVWPSSVKVLLDQPSSSTKSIGGIKYVRNSGFMRWQMEVVYPPMSGDQFNDFWATAQQARGQSIPFNFKLREDSKRIFNFNDVNTNNYAYVKTAANIGDSLLTLEGFGAGESIKKGQLIKVQNRNGFINTIVTEVNSNVYGEVQLRTAYPLDYALAQGELLELDPEYCVATLTDSGFEYTRDTAGFYYVTVKFDLDEWK